MIFRFTNTPLYRIVHLYARLRSVAHAQISRDSRVVDSHGTCTRRTSKGEKKTCRGRGFMTSQFNALVRLPKRTGRCTKRPRAVTIIQCWNSSVRMVLPRQSSTGF